MNRWSALAVLFALAAALAFRIPRLETRPLHNDEAVNAIKVAELWEQGRYQYDPDEYHGPTLHYATVPFLELSGAKTSDDLRDRTLRHATVLFGAALILLLLFYADALGGPGVAWSAVFIAISPAMVFYSRYFIHEMLLVFFSALAIGAGWRYIQTRAARWAMLCGAGVGLMFATKETFVLSLGAMGLALMGTVWLTVPKPASLKAFFLLVPWRDVLLAFAAMFVIWLLFFSSFFTNFTGLLDSVRTYLPWLKRAGGDSPHIHPWYFYLQRLAWFHPIKGPVWSEALILGLAAVGAIASFRPGKSPLLKFLTLYPLILTAVYSVISYKTPWCLLNFYLGMILLAGIGAAALIESTRKLRMVVVLVLLALTGQLAFQSWRTNFVYTSDRRNPYVYAQTVPDILKLVERVHGLAAVSADGYRTILKVISPESDYWPLPWYFRQFQQLGWYDRLPENPFAPIMVVASKLDARLDDRSERKWIMAGISELRPGIFFELYVEFELWKKYVATLPPPPAEPE